MYNRPIESRYIDPVDLIWYAAAARWGIRVRRNPAIFSMTDGTGLLELGPKDTLDADDSAAQMIFHELCHWITHGVDSFFERDWGFPLDDAFDWREHACLRLQANLAGSHGLRLVLAPTSPFRQYYDRIPPDTLLPLPGFPREEDVVALTRVAIERAAGPPWGENLQVALRATAQIRAVCRPFLADYATDIADDSLPSLWSR